MVLIDGRERRKAWFPLESHPDVFTEVTRGVGVSSPLAWADVLSIDEPEILAMTPRPALALVLVFPTTPHYHAQRAVEESTREAYTGKGEEEHGIDKLSRPHSSSMTRFLTLGQGWTSKAPNLRFDSAMPSFLFSPSSDVISPVSCSSVVSAPVVLVMTVVVLAGDNDNYAMPP